MNQESHSDSKKKTPTPPSAPVLEPSGSKSAKSTRKKNTFSRKILKVLKRFLGFGVPILIGVGVLTYIGSLRTPPVQQPVKERSALVRVINSYQVAARPSIKGFGTARPAKVWNAVAQVAGKIDYIYPDFKNGSIIKKGTEIIRISPKDHKLSILQSEANIRSANARLKELGLTRKNAQASLRIEHKTLDLRQKDLNRKRQLLRRRTISQAAYDQESRNLLNQKQRVQEIENSLKLMPTQVAAQREQIEVQKAQLETARLNLERTHIFMPFDGLVSANNIETTQFVTVGQTLGTADAMHSMEIDVQFAAEKIQSMVRLLLGNTRITGVDENTLQFFIKTFNVKADVIMELGNQTVVWQGDLRRISDTIDPKTRTVGLVVAVDDSYKQAIPGFRPPLTKGTFVQVMLSATTNKTTNVVPRAALHKNNIYLVDPDNRLKIMPVTPTFTQGSLAFIKEHIPQKHKIIISDFSPAIAGMLLRPRLDEKEEQNHYAAAMGKRIEK